MTVFKYDYSNLPAAVDEFLNDPPSPRIVSLIFALLFDRRITHHPVSRPSLSDSCSQPSLGNAEESG